MASSKIKSVLEYAQTKIDGASIGSNQQITELTIPSDGTYLIAWAFAWSTSAWFNGVTTLSSDDYHVGTTQFFTRACQANERIWLKNGAGNSQTYYGTFTAIKLA